ncbi:hypothetical protein BTN50_1886 [Candidatus Enterovibrio altilux]|uniref:Mobile element protein n=1 Tax=Candidatus Enterovibrio altilux TaxID=1927128 RepID=A0A291BBD5_9GAMM|nr:hypothetical protein BTN50_1886 [Candidatus Enterovibrio luxaltus]
MPSLFSISKQSQTVNVTAKVKIKEIIPYLVIDFTGLKVYG